jgi:hypothetical protein
LIDQHALSNPKNFLALLAGFPGSGGLRQEA